jgi:hypothetical protein
MSVERFPGISALLTCFFDKWLGPLRFLTLICGAIYGPAQGLAEILACNTAELAIMADSLWTQDDPEVPADGTIEGEVEVKVRDNRT